MIKKLYIYLRFYPLEGYIWIASLFALSLVNTQSTHFTICPFNNLGFDFCPGCGLGRSINFLFSFNLQESFSAHPLGGAALVILLYRVLSLTKISIRKSKTILSY